jgi:hypothetical protein
VEPDQGEDQARGHLLGRAEHAMGGGSGPIWSLMLPFRRIQL